MKTRLVFIEVTLERDFNSRVVLGIKKSNCSNVVVSYRMRERERKKF